MFDPVFNPVTAPDADALMLQKKIKMDKAAASAPARMIGVRVSPPRLKRIKIQFSDGTDSSNIESIGYDVSRNVLQIEFKGGSIYDYANVGETTVLLMLFGDSVGKFFNANIKAHPDRFPFTKQL
jgi:hypothetical protein